MSEEDEPTKAADDERDPNRVRVERAWDTHPQVELLNERKRERDQNNQPTWMFAREVRDDGWVEYLERPIDPFDKRPAILVCGWPESVEVKAEAEWRARIKERHAADE